MTGRARIAAVVVVLIALGIAAALALRSEDDEANRPAASGAEPAPKPKPKAPAGTAAPRPDRERVRRGEGTRPDTPAPGTGALIGIADQKAETFADPQFRRLGVTRSRLNTPWNAIFTEPERLAAWLDAARGAGVEPLIAFHHARGDQCPNAPCKLPSVAQYERAVRAFHRRYPWVRLLQPWNEANSATQPTAQHPERVAAYYGALRRTCPTCVVTGADVLDSGNLTRWLRRFRAAVDGPQPQLWGLHNYSDTNRFRNRGTRQMLDTVPGEIWLTEAGGIVSFTTGDGRPALPYDEQRAARAIRYLFRLAGSSSRITRVYIYQWKIDFQGNRFDAGLVGPDGKPRPALREVLKRRALFR